MELIRGNLTTKTNQETTVVLEENPIIILREEYKFVFPSVDTNAKSERYGNHKGKRVKRQAPGVIKSKDIHAKNIETDKMFARRVKADVVRANKVNAIVISIGKAFSMHRATNKGKPDTLVLNRDGPDPTDSAVTIVLERDGEPVSINGHPSDIEEKRKLITVKNSVVSKKNEKKSRKNKQPKQGKRKIVLPQIRNQVQFGKLGILNSKPRARLIIRQAVPTQRTRNTVFKPVIKPKPATKPKFVIKPKPVILRKPVNTKILATVESPMATRSLVNEVRKKQLLMEHWRKKIIDYQKRRKVKPLIVTRNKIVRPLRPPSSQVRLRGSLAKLVKPFVAIPVRLRPAIQPSFAKPLPKPIGMSLPLPQFRRQNMLIKPRRNTPIAKIKPLSKSDDLSDIESNDWDDDDKIDGRTKLPMKTFERVRPSFDDSDDDVWYDSEDYFYDSSYDDEAFSNEKSGQNLQRKNIHRKNGNHKNNFDEYSYNTEETSEYEYYSESDTDASQRHKDIKKVKVKTEQLKDDDKHSHRYNEKHSKGDGADLSEEYYSSEYEYYSDESDIETKRPTKSLDSIQSMTRREKIEHDTGDLKEKKIPNSITDKRDVQKQKINNFALSKRNDSKKSSKIIRVQKPKSSVVKMKTLISKSFDNFYTESDESDSVVSLENKDTLRKNFFTDSAEQWFNNKGDWDFTKDFDSFESSDKSLNEDFIPQNKLLFRLIK